VGIYGIFFPTYVGFLYISLIFFSQAKKSQSRHSHDIELEKNVKINGEEKRKKRKRLASKENDGGVTRKIE
jgi:hypothetical protein